MRPGISDFLTGGFREDLSEGLWNYVSANTMWLGVWALPILFAMAYDYRKQRVLHPVYLLGLASILVRGLAPRFIVHTDSWTTIVNWVIAR